MQVRVTNIIKDTSYTVSKLSDCKDEIDLNLVKSCLSHKKTICMGIMIAEIISNG